MANIFCGLKSISLRIKRIGFVLLRTYVYVLFRHKIEAPG